MIPEAVLINVLHTGQTVWKVEWVATTSYVLIHHTYVGTRNSGVA